MAPKFLLHIQEKSYSAEQIRQMDLNAFSGTESSVRILRFCKEWLRGKKTFTVHTSGSTGNPKAISLSRNQMMASARQTVQALGLEEGAKAILCMNPAYIGGKMMLVRALEYQMELWVLEAQANPFANLATDLSFDFTALVPLQLETILKNPHSKSILEKMKAVIIGGAPVSWQLRLQVQNSPTPIYSTYGMTETVSHIALQRLNGPNTSPYYTAFPEISLSQDERGCLVIEGAVTGGEKIVTNDVVELADFNQFRWIGRADHIINSGGVKIQLEKIDSIAEKLLKECGQSRPMFAWGLPDERLGQKLVLLVEGEPLDDDIETRWKDLLACHLIKFEQPKSFFYLPAFRLTASGKIQKAETVSLLSKT